MSTKQDEEIIISTWLNGDRKETIELFDKDDFVVFSNVFGSIRKRHKEGQPFDLMEISKETGHDRLDIYNLIGVVRIDFEGCCNILKAQRLKRIVGSGKAFSEEYFEVVKKQEQLLEIFNKTTLEKKDQSKKYIDELIRISDVKPVYTGISKLDRMLGGLRQGELTTVGARPSVGKSAFCLQVAQHASEQKKKVLFFALEMSELELGNRNMQKWTGIQGWKLRRGFSDLDEKETKSFMVAHETKGKEFYDYVYIETNLCNVDMFASVIENEKPDLVIIDQLSCLRPSKYMDIRPRFCYCTTLLKRIAMEKNVPILLAAQVGRSGDNRKPTLSDLKESSSIEEDSDNCMLLWRADDTKGENGEPENMVLELAKHRQGETGAIALVYDPKKIKFYEVTK